jgi:hypothetical protein
MSETSTFLRYTKSFKKYTEEYEPRVVDYVREWAPTADLFAWHEDNSLIKVTGTKAQIDGLLEVLKDRFAYIPPEMKADAKTPTEE